jgi:hemerythrin-like domain-containing protein
MCEYCGCQAIGVIGELTSEHETVLGLLADARRALANGDIDEAAQRARGMAAVLGPHTEVEEHGLFPGLSGDFAEHVATLEAEHRRIEAVLGEASLARTDRSWPARFTEVARLLHEHILKEQDGLFPAALATLTNDQWEQAEEVRSRVSGVPG